VFSLAENTKNVDAFSCWRNGEPYVFLNTFKTTERSRFDAAHELGHLVLHKHGGPKQGRSAEHEAHLFAASFLMPEDDVLATIPYVVGLDGIVRSKGRSCLLALDRHNKAEARSAFAIAIDIAKRQAAVVFERRAQASLSKFAM
jgi:Zn-dependent peptidase ImmA (M78 family)